MFHSQGSTSSPDLAKLVQKAKERSGAQGDSHNEEKNVDEAEGRVYTTTSIAP